MEARVAALESGFAEVRASRGRIESLAAANTKDLVEITREATSLRRELKETDLPAIRAQLAAIYGVLRDRLRTPDGSAPRAFSALGASAGLPMPPASAAPASCPARKMPCGSSAAGIPKRSLKGKPSTRDFMTLAANQQTMLFTLLKWFVSGFVVLIGAVASALVWLHHSGVLQAILPRG